MHKTVERQYSFVYLPPAADQTENVQDTRQTACSYKHVQYRCGESDVKLLK